MRLPAILRLPAVAALSVLLASCDKTAPTALGLAGGSAVAPLPASARYIIELQTPGSVPTSLAAAIAADGGTVIRSHAGTGLVLVGGLSSRAATALRTRADVRTVVPDFVRQFIPTYPGLRVFMAGATAGHSGVTVRPLSYPAGDPHNAVFYADTDQWNISTVQADTAWEVTTQGAGTEVYILDTGIDTAHIELKGGRIDLSRCTSFAYAPTDTLELNPLPYYDDVVGHGTFVSGIVTTNSINLAPVAPKTRIVMVRVLDDSGSGSVFNILSGILYAADSGADVINMSLGGYLARNQSIDLTVADILQRVVDYAYERGSLVVAAAGNDTLNTNTATAPTGSYADSMDFPAGLQNVLSVGATAPRDQMDFDSLASYSNYGETGVAVFAPGGDSVAGSSGLDYVIGPCSAASNSACATENQYYVGSGTSFATPHASGEAAVAKSQSGFLLTAPTLTPCEEGSAVELGGVRRNLVYGYGEINVLRAATLCKNSWTFVP